MNKQLTKGVLIQSGWENVDFLEDPRKLSVDWSFLLHQYTIERYEATNKLTINAGNITLLQNMINGQSALHRQSRSTDVEEAAMAGVLNAILNRNQRVLVMAETAQLSLELYNRICKRALDCDVISEKECENLNIATLDEKHLIHIMSGREPIPDMIVFMNPSNYRGNLNDMYLHISKLDPRPSLYFVEEGLFCDDVKFPSASFIRRLLPQRHLFKFALNNLKTESGLIPVTRATWRDMMYTEEWYNERCRELDHDQYRIAMELDLNYPEMVCDGRR